MLLSLRGRSTRQNLWCFWTPMVFYHRILWTIFLLYIYICWRFILLKLMGVGCWSPWGSITIFIVERKGKTWAMKWGIILLVMLREFSSSFCPRTRSIPGLFQNIFNIILLFFILLLQLNSDSIKILLKFIPLDPPWEIYIYF